MCGSLKSAFTRVDSFDNIILVSKHILLPVKRSHEKMPSRFYCMKSKLSGMKFVDGGGSRTTVLKLAVACFHFPLRNYAAVHGATSVPLSNSCAPLDGGAVPLRLVEQISRLAQPRETSPASKDG